MQLSTLRVRRRGLLALSAVVLVLVLLWLSGGSERAAAPTATLAPLQTVHYATVLPTPAHIGAASFFPGNEMAKFAYCADCYPHIAARYPPETPCANWENGGLQWFQFEDHADLKLGWGAVVWQGPHRFCGFPQPYPEKPADPPEPDDAPDEWLRWNIEATDSAAQAHPMATATP
ncbi:MAG: hypothetical protein OXG02_11850 [Chloroflexi bacterium]|nr:hypothetical protein [Chloroflexota bacterium]